MSVETGWRLVLLAFALPARHQCVQVRGRTRGTPRHGEASPSVVMKEANKEEVPSKEEKRSSRESDLTRESWWQ